MRCSMEKEERKDQNKYWHRFWTVPNGITLLRIASACGLVTYLSVGGFAAASSVPWLLPAWAIGTAATDFVDGTLARKLHQQSKWGQALDPIADKILNWGIGLSLIVQGIMPAWVLAIGARDLSVGIFTAKKKYQDGKKQLQLEQEKKQEENKDKKKNSLEKAKEMYHNFKRGEAPNPTYPAKMKMALQSVGGIATLAFGFGSMSIPFLAGIMAASTATMLIPEKIPVSSKVKKAIQLVGTALVATLGVAVGGISLLAPSMMSAAIAMVVPEVLAIRKEESKEKQVLTTKIPAQERNRSEDQLEEKKQTSDEKEKQLKNVKTVASLPLYDYTEIDRFIEEQMQKENPSSKEESYQKKLKRY